MLPDWIYAEDNYIPQRDSSSFAVKTMIALGRAMSRISIQRGHEKKRHLPALTKFIALIGVILTVSITRHMLVILIAAALLLVYLCTWPARDILGILKTSLGAGGLTFLIFLPAMLMDPEGIGNNIMVIIKVLISVAFLSIYNHTTQWNHITGALRRLHIPGVFIFLLDMTLKYIVLLGKLIEGLLTALRLRSVGRNDRKYSSVGGVMGITFIRGAEMNRQMYEAMLCRGFTDDYENM